MGAVVAARGLLMLLVQPPARQTMRWCRALEAKIDGMEQNSTFAHLHMSWVPCFPFVHIDVTKLS